MKSSEVRKKYLDFFIKKGHKVIPSSSLVPANDKTVLLTTAGMQQFKPYFAGVKDPVKDFGNKNFASCQKCFRTSDIDEVGDKFHLTFFEMLGNFSLGGYGKKEAIEYAWELMTSKDWYGLLQDRFFATVFAGDDGTPEDTESEKIWRKIAPNIEVKKLSRVDNFWPNPIWIGTCGPSSELHYILDDGSSVEVWNLVFTQYFHNEDGSFKDLGQINIDTGMGLERLLMILQEKNSVFETDLFLELSNEIKNEVSRKNNINETMESRIRIFLDHSRGVIFLIADGVRPGKHERESILRTLIRKANDQLTILQQDVSHIQSMKWWGKALNHFRSVYEDIYQFSPNTLDIIKEELIGYGEDVSSNAPKVEKLIALDPSTNKAVLSQNTQKYLGTQNVQGFMDEHRFTSLPSVAAGSIAFDAKSTFGFPIQGFPGTATIAETKLGKEFIKSEFDETTRVFQQVHQEKSRASIDKKFMGGLAGHSEKETKLHTANHLMQAALRQILGTHVRQHGSNITAERLRYDFSHDQKLTDEEIKKVEDLVNEQIKKDLPVHFDIEDREEAIRKGALTNVGEAYPEKAKVYKIGTEGSYFSKELCGGPHVEHTGIIGKFKILKQENLGAGLKRIYATIE